jgi:hypothetical protein
MVIVVPSSGQQPILSPRDSTEILFNGKRVSVEYGSPSLRNRPIMGEFVPYNKVWRTGSGKATTLEINADLRLGETEIPRGSYSLYTVPSPSQWKLIINKQTGQWGTVYNADLDLARVHLNQRKIQKKVQQLKFSLEKNGDRRGVLRIEWEFTSLWISFEILEDAFVASPRESMELRLNGKLISVNYGRPFRRGRKIEGQVVPFNEVWRTGANEATTLRTETPLTIKGVEIPAGMYSLYTIPASKRWRLIINKQTGQSGTEYDRVQDIARITLNKETLKSPVDQFTILLEKTGDTSAVMRLMWEYFMLSVPMKVSEGRRNDVNSRGQ